MPEEQKNNNSQSKQPSQTVDSGISSSKTHPVDLTGSEHDSSATLLHVLEEKDKLIVSLKEASTKRDKLNEQQIRMLSIDNQKKLAALRAMQQRYRSIENQLLKKGAELAIYRITNEKITEKVEALKNEIELYKKGVIDEINNLNRAIQTEFKQKDLFLQTVTAEFNATIDKLEKKIREVEQHYLDIIQMIATKQNSAKQLIREAMEKLQDALSFLDMGNVELFKPQNLEEEMNRIVDSTRKHIAKTEEELRKEKTGDTIIKNIETVNIKLSAAPRIENIVSEISRIRSSAEEEVSKLGTMKDEELSSYAKAQYEKDRASGGKGSLGGNSQSKTDSGISSSAFRDGRTGSGSSEGSKGSASAGTAGATGSAGTGGTGGTVSTAATFGQRWDDENKNRTIIDRDNFAPFDWKRILSDLQLSKYSDLIRICNEAIKNKDYVKAIKLFKTIREQPGILEQEITTKMIDDEIEYLEKVIKDKYTRHSGDK